MPLLQLSCTWHACAYRYPSSFSFLSFFLPLCLLYTSASLSSSPSLQIYSQTHDEHFHLIVVDYHSEDLNVEEELKKSSLKR